ncbi:hypothetical protein BDE02_06G156300 [Populus trichocarpa]|nr:hypothetical protein BDE02_06G156300 [Populus trichocarpa]
MHVRIEHQKHSVGLDRKRSRPSKDTTMKTMNRRRMFTRNKRIAIEKDYDIDLLLSIDHAEGLDNPSTYPSVTTRDYRVVFWVHPDDQLATSRDLGSPDPVWNQKCRMKLDKSRDCKFLYVEVLRYGSSSESNPGTSNGISLVGRAQIPLPNLSSKTDGRYGLVRPKEDGYKAEGHITLSMKLVKIDII